MIVFCNLCHWVLWCKEAPTSVPPRPYQGVTALFPLHNQGSTASTGTPFSVIALVAGGIPNGQVEPLLVPWWKHLTLGQLSQQNMSDLGDEKQIFSERKVIEKVPAIQPLVSGPLYWLRDNWHYISVTVWDHISLSARKHPSLTGAVSWILLDLFSEQHFIVL